MKVKYLLALPVLLAFRVLDALDAWIRDSEQYWKN